MTADPKPPRPQDPEQRVIARMLHALAALPTLTARRRVLFYIVARLSEQDEGKQPSAADRLIAALEGTRGQGRVETLPFNFDGGPATAGGTPDRETVRDGA